MPTPGPSRDTGSLAGGRSPLRNGGCGPLEGSLRAHRSLPFQGRTRSSPLLPCWFNLRDPAAEDALYDMESMRRFVGIDVGHGPVPHQTTHSAFYPPTRSAPAGEKGLT
ncbi:MAG: transposase [Methanoculleus marisnigri]|nr:transposase [Methanoculleus marisnigri]